jgi:hypothetical protein
MKPRYREIWLRSPAGDQTQVTSLQSITRIEALGPAGEIVFRSDATGKVRRYMALAGQPPAEIGADLGEVRFIGGQPYVAIGGTLFRIQ